MAVFLLLFFLIDSHTTVANQTEIYEHGIESKKISNDQELIQSDPTSYPQNQNGNN